MNVDDYYLYPNSSVLRNKLNLRFQSLLDQEEVRYVRFRFLQLENDPSVLGEQSFNFDYLERVHKYLFQDVYEWAGEVKLQNTYKENISYTDIEDIGKRANEIFRGVRVLNMFYPGMEQTEFCEKGGELSYDIHFLHPFREGNSRTERTYMLLLAKRCEVDLDYSAISQLDWRMTIIKANKNKSYEPFSDFLQKACRAAELRKIGKLGSENIVEEDAPMI